MSENKEMPKLSLLQQFVQQRDYFIQQSNQSSVQFQQIQGAIFACNEMIAKIEKDAIEKIKEIHGKNTQGEKVDGKVNCENPEQAA